MSQNNNKNTSWDVRISFIRVISMFLIIATHFFSAIEKLSFLGQVTNAAIYTFLLISAYLNSKKTIKNSKQWLLNRLKKILIPMYLYMIVLFILHIYTNQFQLNHLLIYFLNLQGIVGITRGAGHFWFMTTIMFCYLLTILLDRNKKRFIESNRSTKIFIVIIFNSIWVLSTYITSSQISTNIGFLLFYIIIYYSSIFFHRNLSENQFITATVITITAQFVRLIAKKYIDDTIFHDIILVNFTNSILGVYIFIFLDRLKFISESKTLLSISNYFDKISYEMFITHYAFIVGPYTIWGNTPNVFTDIIFVLLATWLSALILNRASDVVWNKLEVVDRPINYLR